MYSRFVSYCTFTCLVTSITALNAHIHNIPTSLKRSEAQVTRTGAFLVPETDYSHIIPRKPSKAQAGNHCGPSIGECAADECCSQTGWCGKTEDHCRAPECQLSFGPACDGNRAPKGASTSRIARDKVKNGILYGGIAERSGIFKCTVPGTVALTYDDGPSEFTLSLLDLLDKYNAKATFFINGNGKGRGEIDIKASWSEVVKRAYNKGHQIGSHTFTHQDLDAITQEQRINQMIYNEMAIVNLLDVFPTYMRPPYSKCKSDCQSLMNDLGYHIILFDSDTEDTVPASINQQMQNFAANLTDGRQLVIGHDTEKSTATTLTEFMLKTISEKGLKAVTVGECLGDPMENWYRTSSGKPFVPPQTWSRFSPPKPSGEEAPAQAPEPTPKSSASGVSSSKPNTSPTGKDSAVEANPTSHVSSVGSDTSPKSIAQAASPSSIGQPKSAGSASYGVYTLRYLIVASISYAIGLQSLS